MLKYYIKVLLITFSFIKSISQDKLSLPNHITETTNINYAFFGELNLQLDIYQPKTKNNSPAIIIVHGGGWFKGDRERFRNMAIDFANYGYVVANISYRLANETTKFPAGLEDVKAAVRWLRKNAKTYKIDPNKIAAIGGSAGGHLVAMAALTGHSKKFNGKGNLPNISSELQASVIMGAGVDYVSIFKKEDNERLPNCFRYFGGDYADIPNVYEQASPITHISKHMNPILMLDGGLDKPGERYVDFRVKLNKYNIPNELVIIPNAKHGQWNNDTFRPAFVKACDDFFKTYLK